MIEVRYQRGLHLPELDLWLDPQQSKLRAFVSHAHADHFARHETALCSEVTATLIHERFRLAESRIEAIPFHVPIERDGFRLRLLPAGHIPGSAMLHVTRTKDNASLLYTGDFKIRRGRTAEPVNFLNADTLIIETTFGLPNYELPNQLEIEASILRFIDDAFTDGETPVLLGYPLGKAQEVLALLHEHGIPALLDPKIVAMTAVCRDAGFTMLPEPIEFQGHAPPGHVVIMPPSAIRSKLLRGLKSKRTAMLTGWAMQPGSKFRYQVDEVIPLSDHADHPGLMECITRVRPKRILTVHGYAREFAAELRTRGMDAWCAMGGDQLEFHITPPSQRANSPTRAVRAICPLADFGDLCRLVGETSSRVAKTNYLATYLRGLETDVDLSLATRWLTGTALPKKSPLNFSPAIIQHALLSLPHVREERFHKISLAQKDIVRTARLILQEILVKPEPLDLIGLARFFDQLAAITNPLDHIERLAARLVTLHPVEAESILKILTGDLRIGLNDSIVEDAIAAAFGAEPAVVNQVHALTGYIGETAMLARHRKLADHTLRPLVAVKCMLPSSLEHDSENNRPLFHKLPFAAPYWLEPKHDGIRAQLHKLGESIALFSADLLPLKHFPEILNTARQLDGDFILDGELVASVEGRPLSQTALQNYLCQQTADEDLFLTEKEAEHPSPLRFIVFDLLWHNGTVLLDHPLLARRDKLESISLHPPFELIRVHPTNSHEEIENTFDQAIKDGHQGIVLKDPHSPYTSGSRRDAWLGITPV